LVAGLVVGAAVAVASGTWFGDWVDEGATEYFIVEFTEAGSDTCLQLERGPIVDGSTIIQAKARITATSVLNSLRFQVATDSDANGELDPQEWVAVAAATVTEDNGVTDAVTPFVTISTSHDGYRLRADRSDMGIGTDTFKLNGP
jgi:hypothetical protein